MTSRRKAKKKAATQSKEPEQPLKIQGTFDEVISILANDKPRNPDEKKP